MMARQRIYDRTNRPKIGIRTLNETEIEVCMYLESLGYKVIKRGWPDFLAFKDDDIRFIEVKKSPKTKGLKSSQKRVAEVLERLGIKVELLHPGNKNEWAGNH